MSRFQPLNKSFKYAFDGFSKAFRNEPNFKIHLTVGLLTLGLALILGFSVYEWLLLAFTIGFVLILELFNTGIEKIVDLVSPEIQPNAKIAKDVAAAAVLLAAILAIIVGLTLFIPKVLIFLSSH